MGIKVSKVKHTLVDGLMESNLSMLGEIASKTVHKDDL